MEKAPEKTRYHMLDTLRGVMIIGVVLSHFLLYMGENGFIWAERLFVNPIIDGISLFGRILFVLLAGLCSRLSHNNLKRGLLVSACSLVISIVTLGIDLIFFGELGVMFIYMGILQLLGVCMLLYALLEKLFSNVKPLPDFLSVVLFFAFMLMYWATYDIASGKIGIGSLSVSFEPAKSLIGSIIGTGEYRIISADCFPLIPWSFAFFAGTFIGKFFKEGRVPRFLCKDICPPVTYIGKKTLWIYLLHPPLIYGIAVLIGYIAG